jgi:hypothetical protein
MIEKERYDNAAAVLRASESWEDRLVDIKRNLSTIDRSELSKNYKELTIKFAEYDKPVQKALFLNRGTIGDFLYEFLESRFMAVWHYVDSMKDGDTSDRRHGSNGTASVAKCSVVKASALIRCWKLPRSQDVVISLPLTNDEILGPA